MDGQASVNGGPKAVSTSPLVGGIFGNLAGFAGDVASLAELQAKLAVADLKESAAKAAVPAGITAAGAGLAVGAIPVLIFGFAEMLAASFNWSHGKTLFFTSLVVLLLAGGLLYLGATRITPSFTAFRRSADELARNVSWIKTVLAYSGRSTTNRR